MILPIHPRPQKDEILSSWLTRVAIANRYNSHTFYRQILGIKQSLWNRDIDCANIDFLSEALSEPLGVYQNSIKEMSLRSYEGYLFEKLNSGRNTWILPLGVYHRVRKRPGFQYCSACLKEDKFSYFRKSWRLAFISVCIEHQQYLQQCCPHCKSPVSFHRLAIGKSKSENIPNKPITDCYFCSGSLTEQLTDHNINAKHFLTESCINLQRSLLRQVIPKYPIAPIPLLLSNGVWVLCNTILGRNGKKIRSIISEKTGLEIPTKARVNHSILDFNCRDRFSIICIVAWLLDDWPQNFLTVCFDSKLMLSDFTDYQNSLPYWLDSIVQSNLCHTKYLPTISEVNACTQYLISVGARHTRKDIAKALGIGTDRLRNIVNH